MPDFDTRKPPEPNEPSRLPNAVIADKFRTLLSAARPRIALVANKLRNLPIASKRRTLLMANTLRGSLMANRLRSLLIGGVLLFVALAVPVGLLIYSSGGLGDKQQKAEHAKPEPSGGSDHPQQKAKLANLKPLDVCVDSDGGRQREASDADPDGEKIVFASGSYVVTTPHGIEPSSLEKDSIEMYVINADGTGFTQLTRSAAKEVGIPGRLPEDREVAIDWSSDGRKIARIRYDILGRRPLQGEYGEVVVCSPDGKKAAFTSEGSDSASATANFTDDIQVVTSAGTTGLAEAAGKNGDENGPYFSPDSERLAFMRDGDVYVANADGSDQTKLNDGTVGNGIATWLPDSEKIVYVSDDGVYMIGVDGTGPTQLADTVSYPRALVLSPDGKKIAFVSYPPGSFDSSDLYVVNVDGTGLTSLTHNAPGYQVSVEGGPFFSPDGKQVALVQVRPSGETDMYVAQVDGTGLTRLTNTKAWEGIVAWVGG
jgi:Tol biopolymer transport system component